MKALFPYLRYLRPVWLPFTLAVICALIYGAFSGFGLPFMTRQLFPLLFPESAIADERFTLAGDNHYLPLDSSPAAEVGAPLYIHQADGEWLPLEQAILIDPSEGILVRTDDETHPWEGPQLFHLSEEGDYLPLQGGIFLFDFERRTHTRVEAREHTPPSPWLLIAAAALLPATFLVRGVSGFFNTYLISYTGVRVLQQLQLDVFSKLQSLPIGFFQQHKSGDLMSRMLGDTATLQNAITSVSNDLIKQPITLIGALGYLIYQSWQQEETLFILLCFVGIALCVFPVRYIGRELLKRAYTMQERLGGVSSIMNENLAAVREIRAFNLQQRESLRFKNAVNEYLRFNLKVVKYNNVLTPAIEFIAACGISVAVVYGAGRGISLNDIIPLVFALYMAYDPIKKIGAINNRAKHGIASVRRLEYILHQPDPTPDPETPASPPATVDTIRFDSVHFHYGTTPVLHDINLEIKGGEVVALVGHSGAGKTTFVNLLPRFYEIHSGNITLNRTDLREYRKQDLRTLISLVSQDTLLFDDTILNNLKIGRDDATDEQAVEAARKAHADAFIESLPNGYATLVGERGTRLSGGQKQRIALARAFLRDAPIIILDEATSALDSESESHIQDSLETLVKDKTVFIIAHRFSTLRLATRILVFDQGHIVADGTHDQLLSSSPLYKDLYQRQILQDQ